MSDFRLYENRTKFDINPWQKGYPPNQDPALMRITEMGIQESEFRNSDHFQQKSMLTAVNSLYSDIPRFSEERKSFDERRIEPSRFNNYSDRYTDDYRRLDDYSIRIPEEYRRTSEFFKDESYRQPDRGRSYEPDESLMYKVYNSEEPSRSLLEPPVEDHKLNKRVCFLIKSLKLFFLAYSCCRSASYIGAFFFCRSSYISGKNQLEFWIRSWKIWKRDSKSIGKFII